MCALARFPPTYPLQWPFCVTSTFLGLPRSSTIAPHWCFLVMWRPSWLLIRYASIPFPVLLWAGIKTPAELISASCSCCDRPPRISYSYLPVNCRDNTLSCASLTTWKTSLLSLEHYCRDNTLRSRAAINSYGGSPIISPYQADYNNSSYQISNTHHYRVCGYTQSVHISHDVSLLRCTSQLTMVRVLTS